MTATDIRIMEESAENKTFERIVQGSVCINRSDRCNRPVRPVQPTGQTGLYDLHGIVHVDQPVRPVAKTGQTGHHPEIKFRAKVVCYIP